MVLNKSVVYLLVLTGAIAAVLSGCKVGDMDSVEQNGGGSGPVNVSKMGGDINIVDAPHGASLNTMGGNIHVGKAADFAKVHTMGGNIVIDQVDGYADASTMGGRVTVNSANGPLKATTMAGDIKARIVGTSSNERDIELSSMAGTIELTVPKDFPMDVRITLAYTKNASRSYQVVDSIGLIQQTSDDWETSMGTPRKYIRAKGRVGSGLNHVTIKTTNGDVIVKQE